MAEDRQVKKYFENLPYGNDSKSSEVHGKANQFVINKFVASLVRKYDEHMAKGDKETAGHFQDALQKMSQQLDNLKDIKEEFAVNYGGGVGGKKLYSNFTDLTFDRAFFTEQGNISFDGKMNPILSVNGPNGEVVSKRIEDVTQDWVIKGTEENDFMQMQQDAQKQSNSMGKPLDFDVDWHVSNLLANMDAWKSFVSDKVGGRYFLNDYLQENAKAINSGEIPDEMLHPESFNPEFDNRLHEYYANRLKRSFDPNFQTEEEARKTDELIAKTNNKNTES
tara:strand:+ start:1098 stop:1934 length:837 start_codon:yes stop_codon:yes gene_type:complete